MKTVQDKDGNIIEVADDTPCHAGKNGELPVMLDAVIDADIFTEIAAREVQWQAQSTKRNALAEIKRLEAEITPRRTREAILGTEGGWLANQESLIAIERAKLNG